MGLDFYPNKTIEGDFVKLRVEAVGVDLDRAVNKYPHSFLNEMARQLTDEIEKALGVEGIADSSVELIMAFATDTYLEHVFENVTYRRLMLLDKVSAPRDFWVKWTRLAGDISEYSEDNIRFELGEDVEQKIREKEYRYLLSAGDEGYHNSMSRKKVTEWREVVKRAAKRGELTKIESDLELSPEIFEIEARIANLLGKTVPAVSTESEDVGYVHSDESEFENALAKMREVVDSASEIENEECKMQNAELEMIEEIEEIEEDEDDLLFEEVALAEEEPQIIEEAFSLFDAVDEEAEETEEMQNAECGMQNEEETVEEVVEEIIEEIIEETAEEIVEETVEEVVEETIEEIVEETVEEIVEETVDEPIALQEKITEPVEKVIATPLADRAAYIRAEIEAKIRLEYESKARIKAEEELIALKCEYQSYKVESEALLADTVRELEALRLEYHNFLQETKRREVQRMEDEAQREAEERELRQQIESQLRREAQERERLEEAAKAALEEQRRSEEMARIAIEEQRRLEETARAALEEQRRLEEAARIAIEEQRRLEVEKARVILQREEQERIEAEARRREALAREYEANRQAELEQARREAEAERARTAMPEMTGARYTYTSKAVKLVFRRSVDPNITTRIHEIIKATVDYYGKDNVSLKIRAMVTDSQTVVLEFAEIPIEEMALLGNIVKILGNSGLGIAKAIIE